MQFFSNLRANLSEVKKQMIKKQIPLQVMNGYFNLYSLLC